MKFPRVAIVVLSLAGAWPAQAFDPGKVPEGLYYNGTDVNQQLWTPLVLARAGQLVDPLLEAQANGIQALEGQGRTTVLQANTAFLYGGCRTDTRLQAVQPLMAKVPTVYVARFSGADCARVQANVLENFHLSRDRQGDNPMPTLLVSPDRPEVLTRWVYGVPGALVGKSLPVRAWSQSELGGRPEPINGVISRSHFVTLPVLEPDGLRMARLERRPAPTYDVHLGEAVHRGDRVVVDPQLHQSTAAFLKEKLWPRYLPRLEAALAQRFGGIAERFFELGLMQGVDIDNTRAFDYVGVARIGVVTRAGPWRWVDVVWCWRSGLGLSDEALHVLRTSEDALYAPGNRYFSNRNPAVWSPHLVVSGLADFDKDKRLEVISTLTRPVGMAYDKVGPASGGSHDLWLRDSAIHAWFPPAGEARKGAWQTVFSSAVHEERIESLRAEDVRLELFGE